MPSFSWAFVHAHDEDGTKQRLKAVRAIHSYGFGIATEGGMGRTLLEDVGSTFCNNLQKSHRPEDFSVTTSIAKADPHSLLLRD